MESNDTTWPVNILNKRQYLYLKITSPKNGPRATFKNQKCLPWFTIKWMARWCPISWRISKRSPMVLFFCAQDQSNSLVPLLPWSTYFSIWRTSSQLFESRSAVEIAMGRTKKYIYILIIIIFFTLIGILVWGYFICLFHIIYTFDFELISAPTSHPTSHVTILHYLVQCSEPVTTQLQTLFYVHQFFLQMSFSCSMILPSFPQCHLLALLNPDSHGLQSFLEFKDSIIRLRLLQCIVSRGSWCPCPITSDPDLIA